MERSYPRCHSSISTADIQRPAESAARAAGRRMRRPAHDSMRIAIDVMGGDDGPGGVIDGALVAARHLQIGLLLVGDRGVIERRDCAASRGCRAARSRFSTRPKSIGMDEPAAAALRRKPRASIRLAAEAVQEARAAALFSAGHTGAPVMAAHGAFGRLPGVDRPALATIIPTRRRPAVLLDSGATVECRPQHLVQFAVMGCGLRARGARLRVAARRAAVGRRGSEQGQRTDARGAPAAQVGADRVCRQCRRARRLRRRGGRHRLRRLHRQRHAEDQRRAGRGGGAPAARGTRRRRSAPASATCCRARRSGASASGSTASEYGGAPLVGLNGLCIVGHGRSSPKAVRNAVAMAAKFAADGLLGRLAKDLARTRRD